MSLFHSMSSQIKETRHFGIVVKDMNKSLHFYRDLLGLEIVRIMDESGTYLDNILSIDKAHVKTIKMSVQNGVTLIELLEFQSHPRQHISRKINDIGPSHIAFTVNNLNKVYQKLKKNNIQFNAPPQTSPDGYAKVTFCYDPDGTPIELVEVLDPIVVLNNTKN